MMKPIFTTAVFFLVITSAFAQDISKENLVGKWKLESVKYNDEKIALEEMFNTSEVYQIYQKDNNFEGVVGSQSMKAKWVLLKNNKVIQISSKQGNQEFEVKSFENNKMTLFSKNEQFSLLLHYKKVE